MPRVIENQGPLWKLILNGVILQIRPRVKARDYRKIWNTEKNESPLKTITRSQAEKLGRTLEPLGGHVLVDWAMRYGNPSIAARLQELTARGCERILVIPLYPQYCAATTATVADEVFRVLLRMRSQPTVRFAPPYYNDTVYIEALASSTTTELARLAFKPEVDPGLVSRRAAGLCRPGRPLLRPLRRDHAAVAPAARARRVAVAADLPVALRPRQVARAGDRSDRKSLAKRGVKSIAVIMPGFAADCLETLEEIAVENAHIFRKHGGENFAAIPCLNDSAPGMLVIWQMALRELKGWV